MLREIRIGHALSISRLAARAGVDKGTLSRWESGACEPRLPELEAVLGALAASERERALVLVRMDAPRAARAMRESPPGLELPPSRGDLLRALRCRRRLALGDIARALRVSVSTVSRWESCQVGIPDSRLSALLDALGVQAEEREWISLQAQAGGPGSPEPLDALEERVLHLGRDSYRVADEPLKDVRFACVEMALWPHALQSPHARELLAGAYAWHGHWLCCHERYREAALYANRALEMMPAREPPEDVCIRAAIAAAKATASVQRRAASADAAEMMRSWLPAGRSPEYRAWLLAEIAELLCRRQKLDEALACSAEACAAAERCSNPIELRLRQFDRAAVLVAAGQASQAVRLLPPEPWPKDQPRQQALEALLWAETLLQLDDRPGAAAWLRRASPMIAAVGPSNLERLALELASRMG